MLFVVLALIIGIGLYFYLGKSATPSYKYSDTVATSTTSTVTTPAPTSTAATPPKNVALDLSTAYARQYKTVLSDALKMDANFNGHYTVASIGCGTGCFGFAVIDKNTGAVFQVPTVNDLSDAAEGIDWEQQYYLDSNLIRVITDGARKTTTYSFDGSRFTLVSTTP